VSIRDRGGRSPRGRQAHRRPTARLAATVTSVLLGALLLTVAGGWTAGARSIAPPGRGHLPPRTVTGRALPSGPESGLGRAADPAGSAATATALVPASRPTSPPASASVPACRFGDAPAVHAGLDDWARTIVDTEHALPADYAPPDLVSVSRAGIDGWGLVRSFVIEDLRALAGAARAAGNPIAVQSAYRSVSRQAEVYAGWVAQAGEAEARRFSARPGHSEHQLGTAIDVRAAAGGAPWTGSFGSTAAGTWVAKHAADFGFVLSYPAGAEQVTCYGAEAWHLRYVGRAEAAAVVASGLTLREWLFAHAGG
jgi:zinc D-Ala-D-Ala carboxypeptidase